MKYVKLNCEQKDNNFVRPYNNVNFLFKFWICFDLTCWSFLVDIVNKPDMKWAAIGSFDGHI